MREWLRDPVAMITATVVLDEIAEKAKPGGGG